jgi:glycosyltransferase involved in cell wall biosynthesis
MKNTILKEQEIDLTFFVPCFNEEKNIANTLDAIISAISRTTFTYEIIVVDDKSKDLTKEVVKEYIINSDIKAISLVVNKFNMGLGRNYVDISFISNGKYYMLVNGDNAEPEETIFSIVASLGSADMIIPYFGKNDSRSLSRVYVSKSFTFLINLISGHKIQYYNGPVIHKTFNVMRWSPDTHGFAYQAEIIVKVLDEKGSFSEVMISNLDRNEGSSSAFTAHNLFSVAHSILQIFLRRLRTLIFYRKI